jgi:predicted nucleic acid-binding protein
VASFFFDSSAIVKRYLTEVGSAWVRSMTDPAAGHELFLVRITGVEVVSAFVRKQPPLPAADLARALADFKQDLQSHYQLSAVTPTLIALAMDVAERRRLRGYDAIQLAAALELLQVAQAIGAPALTFISADSHLNTTAAAEGLIVDNPLNHP